MTVNDPEPNIPNDDTGKGLKVIGVMLVLWAGFSFMWIPPHLWMSLWMPIVDGLCLVVGLAFIIWGFWSDYKAPSEDALIERTHDLMEATHSGHQNDDPAVGDGPGRFPTRDRDHLSRDVA